jgi:hypothetical protein
MATVDQENHIDLHPIFKGKNQFIGPTSLTKSLGPIQRLIVLDIIDQDTVPTTYLTDTIVCTPATKSISILMAFFTVHTVMNIILLMRPSVQSCYHYPGFTSPYNGAELIFFFLATLITDATLTDILWSETLAFEMIGGKPPQYYVGLRALAPI